MSLPNESVRFSAATNAHSSGLLTCRAVFSVRKPRNVCRRQITEILAIETPERPKHRHTVSPESVNHFESGLDCFPTAFRARSKFRVEEEVLHVDYDQR